eukprot:CAMPEP_0185905136 /NCGR_PEP_ID=MMETSP0196C-20130402/4388_1 /TAXON_ID=2932 /ORGANISM="Alexandrium fundyense, Strain CCMP1719" /LENGTH=115 /DNA_ID=CAMNT_0028624597 /DNA_START=11 /DNA_END=356 /DNA_ORIENTATION=+
MVTYMVATSLGPVIGLIVFITKQDRWTLDAMKWVIAIGVIIGQFANIPAWRMDDSRALGEQSEAVYMQQRLNTAAEGQEGEAGELVARAGSPHALASSRFSECEVSFSLASSFCD